MRYELHNGAIHVSESLQKAITHKIGKIEERLKRYHPDVADLEIRLTHMEKVDEYECSLVLKAFKDTLFTKKDAPELRVAVDRGFDALLREIEQYRSKLNKSLQAHG